MRCPYCQTVIAADAVECVDCRLTFPRTSALVGAMPRLTPLVADTTGMLTDAERAKLRKRVQAILDHFPELVLQLALHAFPPEHPFSMHAFWMFNAGNFAGESRRGKSNCGLLVVLDTHRGEAAIVPGYGLEPLLPPETLDHLLELAEPAWQSGRWADGLHTVLEGLDRLLESVAVLESSLPRKAGEF